MSLPLLQTRYAFKNKRGYALFRAENYVLSSACGYHSRHWNDKRRYQSKKEKQITPKILTLIQTQSLPKGKGFFLSRWKEKQHQCLIKHQCRFTRFVFISVQNDIWIFFCKVLHFFRIAVDAKEHKIFISVLLIPIYFFRLFKHTWRKI